MTNHATKPAQATAQLSDGVAPRAEERVSKTGFIVINEDIAPGVHFTNAPAVNALRLKTIIEIFRDKGYTCRQQRFYSDPTFVLVKKKVSVGFLGRKELTDYHFGYFAIEDDSLTLKIHGEDARPALTEAALKIREMTGIEISIMLSGTEPYK